MPAAPRADNQPARLGRALALRLFLPFAAGYFLSHVFRTVNAVAAPNLVADTGVSANALGFLTSTYMAAFALLQLPLGLLLDRFGPRPVEAGLLLVAALGSGIFAVADGLAGLSLGRALIGAGVSGCMMAAFKAFATWFPGERLPVVNACLLACGALGSISATVPAEWFLAAFDWHALFVVLAGVSVLVAAALFRIVPDHDEPPAHLTLRDQLHGLARVFRSRLFRGLAPLSALSMGSSFALIGLWLGPWLRDVGGLERAAVAGHLMIATSALGVGFLVTGVVTARLARAGVRPMTVAGIGMALFIAAQGLLAAGVSGAAAPWLLAALGFFAAAGTASYAVLSQYFESHLAGRANTALNVLVFASAFVLQWGMGTLLGFWEDPVSHRYALTGYRVAFAAAAALQAIALAWFVHQWRREPGPAPGG